MRFAQYVSKVKALYADLGLDPPLLGPARAASIAQLEKNCSIRLPVEIRAAWNTSDGTREYGALFARRGYLTGYDFLSTARALKERDGLKRRAAAYKSYVEPAPRDKRIQAGWFEPAWIPFAGFGGATLLLMLDFAPRGRGRPGQVISFTHDPDRIEYVASSFERFLDESLAAITANPEDLIGSP